MKTAKNYHYILVCGTPVLVILRVPYPMPRWKDILKGLTPVMREQGMCRKKAVLDGLMAMNPQDRREEDVPFIGKLQRAFQGDKTVLKDFRLYRWSERLSKFILARKEVAA